MSFSMPNKKSQAGFTLLEMMVGAAIFLVVSGAVMALLNVSQKRYKTDTQVLSAFQEARLAMDQMTRDINDAGYPPQSQFANLLVTPASMYAQTPYAWSPGYVTQTTCSIGACTSPGDFDLIIETDVDNSRNVSWVRYQLVGSTLYRGVVVKTVGVDAATATSAPGVMAPYVTNVVNNASAATITSLNNDYPGLFPGGAPVPVFTYYCDLPNNAGVGLCTGAGVNNTPNNIREVAIDLIVRTKGVDEQSGDIRAVTLNGMARRLNPNQ
jgi:prepilin-type N-terminal cleavage/methylation domain-containing protein